MQRRASSAEVNLQTANAALSAATRAGLKNLDDATVTAPREGIVWRRVAPGTVLSGWSRSLVVQLAQDDLLRLKVELPNEAAHRLHTRQIIYVHAVPFTDPARMGETFSSIEASHKHGENRGT